MFRILSIIAFTATIGGCLIHFIFFRPILCTFGQIKTQQRHGFRAVLDFLAKLAYFAGLLCFAVLLFTGFYQKMMSGQTISGYFLMAHATAAPVFITCILYLAVYRADHCRFDKSDWLHLVSIYSTVKEKHPFNSRFCPSQKATFWLIIILIIPTALSIVSSMFPIFGTEGQEFLLQMHRYTALILSVVIIIHIYLIIIGRIPIKKN